MDPMISKALRHALNEADFDAAAMTEEIVAVWKNPAPANAQTMTRRKLRNLTKKKESVGGERIGKKILLW